MTIEMISKLGGGGGNSVKNPKLLMCACSDYSDLDLKTSVSSVVNDLSSTFWTYINRSGSYLAVTSNDTYETVVDITDQSGRVYTMISPVHAATGTGEIKFKVTVDGTEYIYGPQVITGKRNERFICGSFSNQVPISTDTGYYPAEPFTYWDIGYLGYSTNTYPYKIANGYVIDPMRAHLLGMPYLFFKDSFKFEVLCNVVHASTYYNYAGVIYNYA